MGNAAALVMAEDRSSIIGHRARRGRADGRPDQSSTANAQPHDEMMSGSALVDALRAGGNMIYIRHASMSSDYADQAAGKAEMGGCSTRRMLSEKGWQEPRETGAGIESPDIPAGTVTTSQYCRAWQTADLAFGRYQKNADLNFAQSDADGGYTDANKKRMKDNVMPMLAGAPEDSGSHKILVGHDDPFEMATGIYPEPMGVTYSVKPQGNGEFRIIAKVAPYEWQTLAQDSSAD